MALKVPTRIYNIQIIQSIKFDQLGFEMPDISCDLWEGRNYNKLSRQYPVIWSKHLCHFKLL